MGPTEGLGSLDDLPDVGLVDDAIHLFQVKRVGDDLRTGDDVLRVIQLARGSQYMPGRLQGRSDVFAKGKGRSSEKNLRRRIAERWLCLTL